MDFPYFFKIFSTFNFIIISCFLIKLFYNNNIQYLYKSGNEYEALTGWWVPYSRYGSYTTTTKNTDNLYALCTSTADTGNSNYYASWETNNTINLSGYSSIIFKGIFKAPSSTQITICILSRKVSTGEDWTSFSLCTYTLWNVSSTNQLTFNIPEQCRNNPCCILISAQNSNGNIHSEFTLNEVYLEK